MIKINDLRTGNIINDFCNDISEVLGVQFDKIQLAQLGHLDSYWHSADICNPIPLTEDLLNKFGAKQKNEYWFEFHTYGIIKHTTFIEFYSSVEGDFICNSVKYVHQLQNLFFSLTGEELVFSTEP